jgi:hypothetical protein
VARKRIGVRYVIRKDGTVILNNEVKEEKKQEKVPVPNRKMSAREGKKRLKRTP